MTKVIQTPEEEMFDAGYSAYVRGRDRVPPFTLRSKNLIDAWKSGWDKAGADDFIDS